MDLSVRRGICKFHCSRAAAAYAFADTVLNVFVFESLSPSVLADNNLK